jgi:hypothetical protein
MTHPSGEAGGVDEMMGEINDQAKIGSQIEEGKPDEAQNRKAHTMQETADKRTELARTGRGCKLGREGKVDEGRAGKSTAGWNMRKSRGNSQLSVTIL